MPEGDTIYRTAETLRRALLAKTVTRFDSILPAAPAVAGRTITAVEPCGKHLLIRFSALEEVPELILHTHMRMTGSWHVYRPDEPWRKPARLAVATIWTEDFVCPCFSAPVVELLTPRQLERRQGFDARSTYYCPICQSA